jgi:hypothetical protein
VNPSIHVYESQELCTSELEYPGVTSTVIVTSIAHCPGSGVKVYVVVAVLSTKGDHVPTMPLLLPTGKFKVCPAQIGGI